MKMDKSAFFLLGAGVLLIARLAMVNSQETPLPFAQTATPDTLIFSSDKMVIPAGDCITLSWAVPKAARVVLHGSNWPDGVQKGMSQEGSSVVCPSAATHYVPNEPVHYTLLASYNDGHTDTQEIVIQYEGGSAIQSVPSATFDPYATPVSMPITVTPDASIAAIFQPYENGWLIWRGDNDTFFILLGDSRLYVYHTDYPLQPLFLNATTPPDRFDPHALLSGIWRSRVSEGIVSELIGWATAPAQTYNARVFGQVDFGFGMTLPDGRYVNLNLNGAWYMEGLTDGIWTVSGSPVTFIPPSYPTLTPTATATPSRVAAVYQAFEHGFMVADEAGGCAYVFAYPPGSSDGNIVIPLEIRAINDVGSNYHYCLEFGGLPDIVFSQSPPTGMQNPAGNFGRVWGAYADVRASLGYATAPEQRYTSSLPAADPVVYGGGPFFTSRIQLPDGRLLSCGVRGSTSGTCVVG
jgi:hypothetical protein